MKAERDTLQEELDRVNAALKPNLEGEPEKASAQKSVTGLRRQASKLQEQIKLLAHEIQRAQPASQVMQELPEARPTFLLKRGDPLNPGPGVQPGVPETLHPWPHDAPPNRLGLARWLTDSRNPLMARVTVNRWWAEFFGRGLVATLEDFGTQSDPPTHPALLDWLAVELVESGWSMKHIHRLIVTSSTYRQDSRLSNRLLARDPDNRHYARGPRLRLPAETIRDQALAAGGTLTRTIGGPPVYPTQPAGIWRVTGLVDNTYYTSRGPDAYRRGLYTIWRRSSPYPSFVAFDAPDRASCTVSRPRTNTPLQALALMNDSAYVDAALALAARVLRDKPHATDEERLTHAYELLLARPPGKDERSILLEVVARQSERYRSDPSAADQLLGSRSETKSLDPVAWAAWFHVTTTLLNLDEAVTKP